MSQQHAVMCEHLYAAFSLKSRVGPGVRDGQLEAVERWRRVLLDIAGEEMLRWAVVQNLLTAIGSYVSPPHLPHQARGYPPGVEYRLLPFGEAALQHFVYLERPEGVERAYAEGLIGLATSLVEPGNRTASPVCSMISLKVGGPVPRGPQMGAEDLQHERGQEPKVTLLACLV